MKTIETKIIEGDSKIVLKELEDNSIDLIVTSPPYADRRKQTYGGIKPEKYVDWFLPISKELLRVLKPTGTFILNIKEKAENGERHTYVIELILALRTQGWFWTEEFMWHKRILILGNGLIVSVILGNDFFNSIKIKNSICIKKKLWFQWVIGLITG